MLLSRERPAGQLPKKRKTRTRHIKILNHEVELAGETTYYENFALSELSDKAKKLMEEGALTPEHLYKLGLFKE